MGPRTAEAAETTRRAAILDAARGLFLHYGFRRTSLEEIAREAGISRTGLYHHFRNKEDIFLAVADEVLTTSRERVAAAAALDAPLAERVRGMLEGKVEYAFALIQSSRHGVELTDAKHQLCGDAIAREAQRFAKVLAGVLRDAERAGEIQLEERGLTPEAAANLLYLSAIGLQGPAHSRPTAAEYRTRLDHLVRTTIDGWRAAPCAKQ